MFESELSAPELAQAFRPKCHVPGDKFSITYRARCAIRTASACNTCGIVFYCRVLLTTFENGLSVPEAVYAFTAKYRVPGDMFSTT